MKNTLLHLGKIQKHWKNRGKFREFLEEKSENPERLKNELFQRMAIHSGKSETFLSGSRVILSYFNRFRKFKINRVVTYQGNAVAWTLFSISQARVKINKAILGVTSYYFPFQTEYFSLNIFNIGLPWLQWR